MTNYDAPERARSVKSAMLSFLGAIAISLATLASADVRLAAGGALMAGFVSECPWPAHGRLVRDRTALLLAFMLGVAATASVSAVYPRLEGWLLAGLAAQPVLLLVSVPIQSSKTASAIGAARNREPVSTGLDATSPWIGNAAATGAAMAIAVLLTRLLKLDHAFWVFLSRASRHLRKGELAYSYILGAASRDPGRLPDRRVPRCNHWNARCLVLGDPTPDRLCFGLCLERRRFMTGQAALPCLRGSILHPAAASGRRRNPSGWRYRDWRRGEFGRSLTPACGRDQTALKTEQPSQNLAAHAMSAPRNEGRSGPWSNVVKGVDLGLGAPSRNDRNLRAIDGPGGGFD